MTFLVTLFMCSCGFVVFIIACAAEGMVNYVGNLIVLRNDSDRPDLCLVSLVKTPFQLLPL